MEPTAGLTEAHTDDVAGEDAYLPTLYQQYIHQTRYARWRDDLGRREYHPESIERYVTFVVQLAARQGYEMTEEEIDFIRQSALNLEAMMSMRALMTAGPAAERDNIAIYNCTYLVVDHPRAFDEAMYLLMCGTGVGFSVERQAVKRLPEVPDQLFECDDVLVVQDNRKSWASAYRRLLALLWAGHIPTWDVSRLRPAGARLKTFGGRASGPAPLIDLFRYTIDVFKEARGRKLTSLECHGLMCKIGDIVVAGGVRRSALISLSNPSDERMRDAKSGNWSQTNPHFGLANNSAVWTEKPDMGRFMKEWVALYESKSGERGIVNREALIAQCERVGRKTVDADGNSIEFGVNPCVTADTWVMTDAGPRQVSELIGVKHGSVVNGSVFDTTDDGFWRTGTKEVLSLSTQEGYRLRLTDNHEIRRVVRSRSGEAYEWVPAGQLQPGDEIKLHDHRAFVGWPGQGTFDEGWLLGELVGDGNFSKNTAQVKFWGESREEMRELAVAMVHEGLHARRDLAGHDHKDYSVVSSTALCDLAESYGISSGSKSPTAEVERGSSEFVRGFIRGLFDADGSVQGDQAKGISIRLGQSDLCTLQAVQRMLLRLGIKSTLYEERRPAGMKSMPDGKGDMADYWCQAQHELVIANDNIFVYQEVVGFHDPAKRLRLSSLTASYKRRPNREQFYATVASVLPDGIEEVYDCSVPGPNAFDANGMYVHNCGEIILRPCGVCNLTEIVARASDTLEDLLRKATAATIMGTLQACATDFDYVRPIWRQNAEEERLLGVSITGQMDHPVISKWDTSGEDDESAAWKEALKERCREVNAEWAAKLNINIAGAITTQKPSGTASQYVDSASGGHARYAKFYVRRTRDSKLDPVAEVVRMAGVPCEQDAYKTENWVFEWPIKAPEGAVVTADMTAIDQLERWLSTKLHYTEHNPSCTIHVQEHEWLEVGAWVYEHFDEIGGLSFLPADTGGHGYTQLPFEEITEEEYERRAAEMPKKIDWSMLSMIESEDNTTGSRELSCFAGACEVNDAPQA